MQIFLKCFNDSIIVILKSQIKAKVRALNNFFFTKSPVKSFLSQN